MKDKCILMDKRGTCQGLNVTNCRRCHFYKTATQLKIETECCNRRLKSLSEFRQINIAEMYFKGVMAWQK